MTGVMALTGVCVVCVGAGLIFVPAGVILAGVFVLLGACAFELGRMGQGS
jgi:hypothetical protein